MLTNKEASKGLSQLETAPYFLASQKSKQAVRDRGHNDARDEYACDRCQKALLPIQIKNGGDQRARPRARSRERNGNEDHHPPIGVFFDLALVFFHLCHQPIAKA